MQTGGQLHRKKLYIKDFGGQQIGHEPAVLMCIGNGPWFMLNSEPCLGIVRRILVGKCLKHATDTSQFNSINDYVPAPGNNSWQHLVC